MSENCYVRAVENPALNEQKVNAITQPLPLVDTTLLSPDFLKKRQHHSSVIGRSRPFRLRKTRADYDIKLLQCGNILLCPASSLALSKPIYVGKVVGLEHYPDTCKVRVKWEFSSSGRKFEFLKKKIDVFLNKFLKELSILPFVQYVSETPVLPVRVHDLTRN